MVRLGFLKIVVLCAILTLTIANAQPERAPGPPDRYIVQVTQDFAPGQVGRAIAQRMNGRLVHVYTNAVKGFSIHVPPGLAKKDIESEPGVLVVEPDVEVYAVAQTLPTGVDRIDAEPSDVTGSVDVDIAIIDTGIDRDHPDLNVVGGRHFYSIWGLLYYEDDLYDDDNGHGTHCAGIAAAIDNDTGVIGVAPGSRLWAVKVLDASGSGYLSDVIAGIDWVTARAGTIEVANMSMAAIGYNSTFRTAIANSVAAGIFYAVAAGNDGKDVYGYDGVLGTSDDVIPAAYPEAATISAMADYDGQPGGSGGSTGYGADDSFASFSNYSANVVAGNPVSSPGKAIDLLMPGVSIYSCYLNGSYATYSGTSMASPHAAGLAALYIAASGRATDAAGVYAIRQALIDAGVAQTNTDFGLAVQNDPDGYKENIGWTGSMQNDPPPPESLAANFSATPTSGYAPLSVQFTNHSTGTITSWSWDFGDGETSTDQNPLHEYTVTGIYTVSLTVSNSNAQDTEIKVDYITVTSPPEPLVADFEGNPTRGEAPLTVHFTDLSTGEPLDWVWDFGDDSPLMIFLEPTNPSHTYDKPGTYTVILAISDGFYSDGEEKVDYITVTGQTGNPPVADFSATPTSGEVPLTVQFTDSSTDNPTSWSWDFGDGVGTSTLQDPSYTYDTPGIYTVSLTATNDYGSDTVTKVDYITVSEPSGEITLTATGYKVKGRKTTDLSWSGATSTFVDIYRDGTFIAKTANEGFYTDRTDSRGGGSFTYQVCEAGTSTCSNEVIVFY